MGGFREREKEKEREREKNVRAAGRTKQGRRQFLTDECVFGIGNKKE